MTVASGRKRSPISNTENSLFFSLVDYRNNYFTSDDPDKIIEFYNGFKNRDQLIQWMRERPKGVANIHEVEGEKDIIVVIPTADFYGKYAKECRDNIFKGLHMVFVESGEAPDPYFNYAHNCNIGIMKAMEHNPKWIVISNDDMYKLDDIHKLVHNLSEHRNADIVYVTKSHHHSHVSNIATPTYFFKLYQKLSKIGRYYVSCSSRFMISYYPVDLNIMRSLFFRNSLNYLEQQSFMIFSINFLKREGAKILFLPPKKHHDIDLWKVHLF